MSKTISDRDFKLLADGLEQMRIALDAMSTIGLQSAPDEPDTAMTPEQAAIEEWDTAATEALNQASAGPAKRAIPWGIQCKLVHPDFIDGLLWIESKIGLRVEELVPCMKFESNIDPKARNPQSSASGLIQFMSATAKNLGTTIEAIRKMDAMQQLSFVYKYFANIREDWTGLTAADVYMAILWPVGIGKPMDYPIFTVQNGAYSVNKGLDWNKDGRVTKAEACKKVLALQDAGFNSANVLYI